MKTFEDYVNENDEMKSELPNFIQLKIEKIEKDLVLKMIEVKDVKRFIFSFERAYKDSTKGFTIASTDFELFRKLQVRWLNVDGKIITFSL